MPTALYYPHTTIRNKALLKNALLLWDTVECVSPLSGKRPHSFGDPVWDEASELIVRDRVPMAEERRAVHREMVRLVESGLPEWPWVRDALPGYGHHPYGLYPDKLDRQTWQLLEDSHLAAWRDNGQVDVSGPLGLLTMSLLADACAGTQKRRITDRGSAYTALSHALAASAGGEYVSGAQAQRTSSDYDRLVSISVRVLNTDDVPIERLVELRRRELREGEADYRALRTRYVDRLESYVKRLGTEARTRVDREQIEREFLYEMRDDVATLSSELRLTTGKTVASLLSKEVVVGAFAVAGVLAAPSLAHLHPAALAAANVAVGVATVAALVRTGIDGRQARQKALGSHTMSWLYVADDA